MSQDFQVIAENVLTNGISGGVSQPTISVATAVSTVIPIPGRIVRVSASAVTTSASCTLANGVLDGQEVNLINESAFSIIISGGIASAAAATVTSHAAAKFLWIATDTAWFHCV